MEDKVYDQREDLYTSQKSKIKITSKELALTDTQLLDAAVIFLRNLQKEFEDISRKRHWYESYNLLAARKFLEAYDILIEARKK